MVKKVLLWGLGIIFIFGLSGCATMGKNKDLEIQGLKNQVTALESQLRAKDDEVNSVRDAASKTSTETQENIASSSEVKDRPTAKLIQLALKNAGYYQGVIDGKKGKNTRQAVKDFQKANNLKPDGHVGKGTWEVLKPYLDKKVK